MVILSPYVRWRVKTAYSTRNWEGGLIVGLLSWNMEQIPPAQAGTAEVVRRRIQEIFSLNCLVCEQYFDRIHPELTNGLHKCS